MCDGLTQESHWAGFLGKIIERASCLQLFVPSFHAREVALPMTRDYEMIRWRISPSTPLSPFYWSTLLSRHHSVLFPVYPWNSCLCLMNHALGFPSHYTFQTVTKRIWALQRTLEEDCTKRADVFSVTPVPFMDDMWPGRALPRPWVWPVEDPGTMTRPSCEASPKNG